MERRRGGEPGQERGVLHRVPGPVPSPAEHLVGPPAAEHDRAGEEDPGCEQEVAQRPDEVVPQPADEERGAGEPERDRHAHVPRVEERGVDHHQIVVLQERVRSGAVERRIRDRPERLRRPGQEEAEEGAASEPDADGVRHVLRVLVRLAPGGNCDVDAHHQAPEEDRPFERGPEADDRHPGGDPATAGCGSGMSSPSVDRISSLMSTFLSAGARYLLSCDTIRRRLSKLPSLASVPSTTTPMRSRKSWGGTPRETTCTNAVPSVTSNSRLETPSPRFTEPTAT